MTAAIATMQALAITAVALRFLARKIAIVKIGADDWLILLALVWAIGYTVQQFLCEPPEEALYLPASSAN